MEQKEIVAIKKIEKGQHFFAAFFASKKSRNMKISILTLGTRGDVQPYAVLGRALQERGHQVRFVAAKNFESLVRSYSLELVPVEADFQAVLNSEDGKKMLKGNPFAIFANLNNMIYPLIEHTLSTFYETACESDVVIYHVKTLADSFADQFPEKMLRASVLPLNEETNEFPNPALSGLPVPSFLNVLTYRFATYSMSFLSKPIKKFRQKYGLPSEYKIAKVRDIYGLSPVLLNVPKEYEDPNAFQGFWFDSSKRELESDLKEFLDAGEKPLVLTFGSMPFKCKFDFKKLIQKISDELQARIIVVKGWGLDGVESLQNNTAIKVIKEAPYDVLFPLSKAIIHHGGIGTTSECLRAGVPFMICPVLYPVGDQMFWGKRCEELGIAVRTVPLSKLSENEFFSLVKNLLEKESLYEKAIKIKEEIAKENGIAATIEKIENYARK
jgi:sterol 3beta-glucosyltransferase